jgi:hypothetical protein
VNLLWGLLAVVVVTAATVAAMLTVRRRAPDGSYFSDGDRASGVFGVLATGFSLLLGFIIFLSFSSYDASRSGAESEATAVSQQVETAQFMPASVSTELTGELVCYGRYVVGPEWDAVDAGTLDDAVNPWGAEMYLTLKGVDPSTDAEQSAYDRWMDQTADRQQARLARIHGAEGIIPSPLWVGLLLMAGMVLVYMLFFADAGERAATQALLMGSVTVVVSVLLLILVFFDHPHGQGVGRLQPTAMERALRLVDKQAEVAGVDLEVPCDERGRST